MTTRAKLGIYKPKALMIVAAIFDLEQEPCPTKEALSNPAWKCAMDLEHRALLEKQDMGLSSL